MSCPFCSRIIDFLTPKIDAVFFKFLKYYSNALITDKKTVSSIKKFPTMAYPGTGEDKIRLYQLDNSYAIFQKNSYPIKKTVNGIFYLYALTIVPKKNKFDKFIKQLSIETDCFMTAKDKPFIGITTFGGHQTMGRYKEDLTEDKVLDVFSDILKKQINYSSDLKFIEDLDPIQVDVSDQVELAEQRRTTPMTDEELKDFIKKQKK